MSESPSDLGTELAISTAFLFAMTLLVGRSYEGVADWPRGFPRPDILAVIVAVICVLAWSYRAASWGQKARVSVREPLMWWIAGTLVLIEGCLFTLHGFRFRLGVLEAFVPFRMPSSWGLLGVFLPLLVCAGIGAGMILEGSRRTDVERLTN